MQCVDRVVAQAARIAVVAAIVMEAAGAAIEQVETAAGRADPQIAARVLDDRARTRIAERVGVLAAMGITRDSAAFALDARDAAAERADPQIACRSSYKDMMPFAGSVAGSSSTCR